MSECAHKVISIKNGCCTMTHFNYFYVFLLRMCCCPRSCGYLLFLIFVISGIVVVVHAHIIMLVCVCSFCHIILLLSCSLLHSHTLCVYVRNMFVYIEMCGARVCKHTRALKRKEDKEQAECRNLCILLSFNLKFHVIVNVLNLSNEIENFAKSK